MTGQHSTSTTRRPYMVAMVLGATLTSLASAQETEQAAPTPQMVRAIDDMSRYCTVCWRNARLPESSWTDCTQEVFHRMLQRVPREQWSKVLGREGEERREFHRAIDAVKKRTQRARKTSGLLDGLADSRETRARQVAEERETVRQAASEVLTSRQQQILQLSFEGWTVKQIADEMSLGADRVSDEKYKAVRKLRTHLQTT